MTSCLHLLTLAFRIALSLEADRIQVLYPDVDTPFEDEFDAVNRLLPYHILQQPKEDLDAINNPKGKSKAVEEIQDTKLSIECHKRHVKLQERFRKARIASGKHPSPTPQAICLERLALESDRHETSNIDQALSAARSELDKLQRANILATMKTSKPATTTQTPAASSAPAYSYSNHTFSVSPAPTYNQFYNSYTYSYGQNGSTPYSANSSVPAFSVQNPTASSAPATKTQFSLPVRQPAAGSSISPPASVAIPLQVPVTLLPSLQTIGILPVPKASLPPPSEPQPAAVLIGTTNNGTMLSLEINAALLQGPQMSGLAVLLSDLVKTSGNNNPPANGTQGNS
ncbi:hypothetical protein SCHPADRAFT_824730 [Schizopora paradoxa]|uniref:GLTSCR protein conserved domain-containing protein n=1 Tax=Schizopora paradoxa TaxID=27342 RepID=A0A0H2S0Z1_9AGAM|nr:hypothetical protein SCHPADRAFT_824730 [Schizopora paradoxa]